METVAWRDKLYALKNLPRPGRPPSHAAPCRPEQPPGGDSTSAPEVTCPAPPDTTPPSGDPPGRSAGATATLVSVPQNAVTLTLCHRNMEGQGRCDDQGQGRQNKGQSRKISRDSEALSTCGDFFNPRVSADQRYEQYLSQMRQRDRRRGVGSISDDDGSVLPVAAKGRYDPGSKGGGWRVLPHISQRHLLTVSSAASRSTARRALPAEVECREDGDRSGSRPATSRTR